jgi:hypothetical protein
MGTDEWRGGNVSTNVSAPSNIGGALENIALTGEPCYQLMLFQQHEFPGLNKISGVDPVEVHAAREIGAINLHLI